MFAVQTFLGQDFSEYCLDLWHCALAERQVSMTRLAHELSRCDKPDVFVDLMVIEI